MELKRMQLLITIWILGNPECLGSVANRFKITKSILFRVYRRICGVIANNLSGQYMKYLLVWNWAPLGKMINFGSFAQSNALDQWPNDLSLDHADQWSDEFLSRVDLIDHWSENGFARKERHRSEILIRILPKERTLREQRKVITLSKRQSLVLERYKGPAKRTQHFNGTSCNCVTRKVLHTFGHNVATYCTCLATL